MESEANARSYTSYRYSWRLLLGKIHSFCWNRQMTRASQSCWFGNKVRCATSGHFCFFPSKSLLKMIQMKNKKPRKCWVWQLWRKRIAAHTHRKRICRLINIKCLKDMQGFNLLCMFRTTEWGSRYSRSRQKKDSLGCLPAQPPGVPDPRGPFPEPTNLESKNWRDVSPDGVRVFGCSVVRFPFPMFPWVQGSVVGIKDPIREMIP